MGWNMALVVKKNETLIREGDTCSINIFPYFTILVPIKKPCIRKTVTWATFQHTVARSTTEKNLLANIYIAQRTGISRVNTSWMSRGFDTQNQNEGLNGILWS